MQTASTRLTPTSDTLALMGGGSGHGRLTAFAHSLPNNRVRVESLFIDEGFGSLYADPLRVAIDMFDGLQALGCKVGVISHVQEKTKRIATKILVQRTAGGRSSVAVG